MGTGSKIDIRETESESTKRFTSSKVDLNDLMRKVKEEEKKNKRQFIVISAAALSAVAAFGIILTL